MNKLIHKKYKANKDFIFQALSNQITIFDGDKSVLYTLNETASYIFRKIKKGDTPEDVTNTIVKRYGITYQKAEKDIRILVSDLISKKIIVHEKLGT
ncbi:hypothetical protein A3D77_01200 [Candidatus Gottesmanbacteria bacterium RIFCSPHIGHO2_02_FULL_39_11]|uniref:PqqD family protein n=1 Tax=Candidatus Gottesmanbacteria bacterium RIFCSPHIGHO2_02_FULL_39_11 TaxID=1798382 RepID=A0A1F5ZVK0_9BACT|nr:MAG: hypothetical protein A3D77_01200 [Candidatus Gottesmanbacteria bacterium RIFCSPHIGHO2_02_FULL_39_11]